jgi:N-acetylglucosamine-6-phosphate deacetylase
MPPGAYRLGQHRIFKEENAVRLADGTLAGSVLTMDRALRNLLHLGVPLEEAGGRCATLPADYLGLAERGRLVPGAVADVVVVDQGGRLEAVLLEGRTVPTAAA